MELIYYIADTHLGHENVIEFDDRPFCSVEEMDRVIIENWRARIRKDDEVYILGDLVYRSRKTTSDYLEELSGRKRLIVGNHNEKWIGDSSVRDRYFESVSYIKTVSDNSRKVVLCHYPLAEWSGMYRGALHLYGHIHNHTDETFRIMKQRYGAFNAGCMINNFMPCTLSEIIKNNESFWLTARDRQPDNHCEDCQGTGV